jgi:outer membrane protein insertion porin family
VKPGDIFDTTLVTVSRQRLENLNYFSRVEMAPADTIVPGRKDLNIVVEEKRTGSFNFGAGFSTIDSLVGFAELSQSNFDLFNWPSFVGGGQRFRIRGQYGLERKDFVASLTEPWFLGYRLSVGVDSTIARQTFSRMSTTNPTMERPFKHAGNFGAPSPAGWNTASRASASSTSMRITPAK